jgi:hypothetical protein
MKRVSSTNITTLLDNEIFVFGSNEQGALGAGAAKQALKFGAKLGQGVGLQGSTYAIPTKNKTLDILTIQDIKIYVDEFIKFAKDNKHFNFLVTEIGCGLAGYTPTDIAPLFKSAVDIENIYLPIRFLEVLNT